MSIKAEDRCCGSECYTGEDNPDEPCWGSVTVVDEEYNDDDYWWIHACTGHEPAYYGGKYKPEPKEEPDESPDPTDPSSLWL